MASYPSGLREQFAKLSFIGSNPIDASRGIVVCKNVLQGSQPAPDHREGRRGIRSTPLLTLNGHDARNELCNRYPSNEKSPGGGIGRHYGLKIHW